jgi:hypothetical protein
MTTAYRMLGHHSKGIGDSGFKVVLNLSHKLATAGRDNRIGEWPFSTLRHQAEQVMEAEGTLAPNC